MAVAAPTEQQLVELRAKLEGDDVFYGRSVLKIIDQKQQLVPLEPKPAQLRLDAVKAKQEAEGKPVRIAVLKARREGISTRVQGYMVKRITQRRNHKALVVAHDGDTAEELFGIGETMYSHLPQETIAGLELRPPTAGLRKGQELRLGEPNRARHLEGHRGINSSYYVDTANEYEAGRGFTYHSLHLSEFAFWKDPEKKQRALFATVPDEPGTMIIIESTANGYNAFRKLWVAAVSGNSDYYALFIPWYEDPDYVRPFADEDEREAFIDSIGTGPYGEDEPDLLEVLQRQGTLGHLEQLADLDPLEQLHWRRWAIVNRCHGDLRAFWQEFPASWEEAFLSSGRQVFAPAITSKVMARCEEIAESEPAERGLLVATSTTTVNYLRNEIQIPATPIWTPDAELGDVGVATPRWEIWEQPFRGREEVDEATGDQQITPPGQYVLQLDAASGAETVSEGQDYFVIQVLNHRTGAQCAMWRARGIDPDIVARELYVAAIYFAPEFKPWVGIEITGGYGVSIATRMRRMYRYPMLYFRSTPETKGEKEDNRLGWSMDVRTKPLVVDYAKELLRDGRDGIRSIVLASELQTFVRDEKGKMGAEEDYFDDCVDSWMVGQYIAFEKPVRRSRWKQADKGPVAGARKLHTTIRRPRGYGRRR